MPETEYKRLSCADCGTSIWKGSTRCKPCFTKIRPLILPRPCCGCGKTFTPRHTGNKGLYCSRECAYKHIDAWRKGCTSPVAEYKHTKMCLIYWPVCETCGKTFLARIKTANTCSEQCTKEKYVNRKYGRDRSSRACKCCGKDFSPAYGDKRSGYCSSVCATRVGRRIGKARRRAMKRGIEADSIDPFKVFDRDGWRCQICGKATPRNRRGSRRTNAPELDHRVPLSKGGPHTYANVQCACRSCNSGKGNRSDTGQLPMFEIVDQCVGA